MKNYLAKLFTFFLLVMTFLGFFSLAYELFIRNQGRSSAEWILHTIENTHFAKLDPAVFQKNLMIHELSPAGRQEMQDFMRIDLNKASVEELETLPRIGPKTAEDIIEYRNTRGFFLKVSDLEKVKGIGPKTIQQMEPYVKVEAPKMSFLKKDSKGKRP